MASEVTARPSLRYVQAPSRSASVRLLKGLPPLKPKPSPHVLDHYTGWGHGGQRITYKKLAPGDANARMDSSPQPPPNGGAGAGARGALGGKERRLRAQCYRQSMVPKLLPPVGGSPLPAGALRQSSSLSALPQARARQPRPKFNPKDHGNWMANGMQAGLYNHYLAM